jgi:dipeptidyl aminopeptidase/acylaminoacyl peptidase
VTLSHDGFRLAWLEVRDGVLNLFISHTDNPRAAVQVTREKTRSLMPVLVWAQSGKHIVFFRDDRGAENYRAFSIDVNTGVERALTPGGGVRSLFWSSSRRFPQEMLFGCNIRDKRFFDLIRIDVAEGTCRLAFENEGFSRLHADETFAVRFGERVREDGSVEILAPGPDAWTPFLYIPASDALTTRIDRLSADGRSIFLVDTRGRDKAALVEIDVASGITTLLAEDSDADITHIIYHPNTGLPLAALAVALRQRWHPIDPGFGADLARLRTDAGDAELSIDGVSDGLQRLLFFLERSDAAREYRLYDRKTETALPLFKERDDLDSVYLRPMHAVTIPARDNLPLPSYLTLPEQGFRDGPLVLCVHGGPYDRDLWGYSAMHQWLASRGYAVLSVNFRGSTGFGKAMVNAADREWGRRMQDDLIDAVDWAISQGHADPLRIGFIGISYGGYAALMAAAKTPERFACFVDVFGPSNLQTFIQAIPPYWRTWFATIRARLADPGTEEGAAWLAERSPLNHADLMSKPLLIVQGLQDVRVHRRESEQIVQAMQHRNVPVAFVTFEGEGHFFVRQENKIAFAAVLDGFLATHLGGTCELWDHSLDASDMRIEAGQQLIFELRTSHVLPQPS